MINIPILSLTIASLFACSDGSENPPAEDPKGDVSIYVTTSNRSQDFKKQAVDFSNEQSAMSITLKPTERFQTMDGFGAAVTGSSAFNLLKMTAENRKKFLTETFSPTEGMGYSYIRVAIGCSDFSLSEYTCWDDKEAGFGLTPEETDYVIPVLKEIIAINPTIKILASPWTCPIWMKERVDDNPWTGGHLKKMYYGDYADYFIKWIQAFKAQGINITSVTPQNEPLNDGNSASLHMDWEEMGEFVNLHLAPKIKASELGTKVYLYDHNYDVADYPLNIYKSGVDNDVVAGAAFHDYGGQIDALNYVHQQAPGKELIFTETSIGTWNNGQDLSVRLMADMEYVALGTVNRWCKAVIVWNLMLDSDMGPNRPGGCQTCYGAVDIFRGNFKDIKRNSHYYIIGHLASVVKPGATRIGSEGNAESGIIYSAFENTDGTYALVLMNNTSGNKKITVNSGSKKFTYEVPSRAVVSYRWTK
ncbi:MAG: glucosylceramidase [Prevotella sp.]|nr:glucosylceramidase [Prevotella sp.]